MSTDIAARFPISVRYGVIMSDQVWSETHVKGGGGGIMVHGIGIGSSSTRSTVKNKREMWIRLEDGREESFTVDAEKVKVRPGQAVVLVYAETKKGPVLMRLHNRATGQSYLMVDGSHLFGWENGVLLGAFPASFLGAVLLFNGVPVGLLMLLGLISIFPIRKKFKAVNNLTEEALLEAVRNAPSLPAPAVA